MPTINLTETQTIAYTSITDKQLQIQNQMIALQQEAQKLQTSLVNISKEVFEGNGVAFDSIDNPVLNDEKTEITYEVKPDLVATNEGPVDLNEAKVLVPEETTTKKAKSKA